MNVRQVHAYGEVRVLILWMATPVNAELDSQEYIVKLVSDISWSALWKMVYNITQQIAL